MLASAYMHKFDYAKAEATLQRVVLTDSEDAEAQYDLGFAQLKLGKMDQAIVSLEKAAQLDPKDANVELALAQAYQAKGMREQAQAAFEKANDLAKAAQQH